MPSKDFYDNNLRRGAKVKERHDGPHGEVVATGLGNEVLVQFEGEDDERRLDGRELIVTERRLGGRR